MGAGRCTGPLSLDAKCAPEMLPDVELRATSQARVRCVSRHAGRGGVGGRGWGVFRRNGTGTCRDR